MFVAFPVMLLVWILSCHLKKTTVYIRTIRLGGLSNANSIRCTNSVFHKVQWWHFSGVIGKLKVVYVNFSGIMCTEIFEEVIKNKMCTYFGTQCSRLYLSSLCWTSRVGSQHDATRTSTFAAEHWRLQHGARSAPAAIDQYLLPAGSSAAKPSSAVAAVDRWDRQTDGRSTVI